MENAHLGCLFCEISRLMCHILYYTPPFLDCSSDPSTLFYSRDTLCYTFFKCGHGLFGEYYQEGL